MGIVLMLHSINRWIVIVIALVTIIRFALVWAKAMPASKLDALLLRAYSADLGIQVLLGLIYLVWSGAAGAGLPGYRIGHTVVALIAVAVAGMAMRWRKGDATVFARNGLIAVVVSLLLIYAAVAMLPGGWMR